MDEIGQEPGRNFRLPPGPRRWLTVVGVAGLVAAIAVFGVTRGGGRHGAGASGGPAATASPRSAPAVEVSTMPGRPVAAATIPPPPGAAVPPDAAGTVLLTCDSVVWRRPDPNWQAGSLRVGTMWLLDGRQLGYARLGHSPRAGGGDTGSTGASRDVEMLVHLGAGSTVVMRAVAGESPYFQFLNSPGTTGDFQGLDGGRGFTFVPCPAPDLGYGGLVPCYDVGFSIVPGRTASVEVLTSTSARPVWLTFTAPAT